MADFLDITKAPVADSADYLLGMQGEQVRRVPGPLWLDIAISDMVGPVSLDDGQQDSDQPPGTLMVGGSGTVYNADYLNYSNAGFTSADLYATLDTAIRSGRTIGIRQLVGGVLRLVSNAVTVSYRTYDADPPCHWLILEVPGETALGFNVEVADSQIPDM